MYEVRAEITFKGAPATGAIEGTPAEVAEQVASQLSRFEPRYRATVSDFDAPDSPGTTQRTLQGIAEGIVIESDRTTQRGYHMHLGRGPEYAVCRADEVTPNQVAKLPDARRYERIERISTDDVGRVVLHNSWGSCALQPDDAVQVEAVTGLAVRPYLRPRVSYVVVHTIGGADNDVETFTDDGTEGFTSAYSEALDLAAEIREHLGHYARIDKVYVDAAQGQEAGTRLIL